MVVHPGKSHRSIVVEDGPGAEINIRIKELLNQSANGVGLRERRQLVTKFEVLEDVLDILREAIEIVVEIRKELLLTGPCPEVAQIKLGGIVKGLTRSGAQRGFLFRDAGFVEHLLGIEDSLLCRLKHRIETPQDAHWQDHVRILATLEEVPKHIVSDAPDERDNLIVRGLIHD